jgi:hypothetical protein
MTYLLYDQYHIRQSSQFHMIDEVIGPGLINPWGTHYVHAFPQLLFHILPLMSLIVVSPNRDLVISAFHLMSVAISQDRLIDAVSLPTVCERDVLMAKIISNWACRY